MTDSAAVQQDGLAIAPASQGSSSVEFTIERSALLKSLSHVQSVVEKRNTIPILSNVRLDVEGDFLSLTATDMDVAITEKLAVEVDVEGALTVPAHTLYDIVRKLPDGSQIMIYGNADGDGKLHIDSGSCKFSLSCLPIAEFPVMEKDDFVNNFTISSAELSALIDKTRFAISTEETRYYLNGIYLHSKEVSGESKLCSVATDGHRLAKIEIDAPEGGDKISGVIVPRKTVAELYKLIDGIEVDVKVSLSDTKICFEMENAFLLSKLIDGTFPEYNQVIPHNNENLMEINTDAFIKAVDRVSTITSDKTRAIKLIIETGKLTLSAVNEENGTAIEEIDVIYEPGETIEIGFNSRYLLEILAGIEGESVKLLFADGSAPALINDPANAGALYVIMPMRI